MSDDLPSQTPQKSGDEKSAHKTASDERNGKPEINLKLTQLEWGGFFGDVFVILWVWSDLIACRDFNRLVFLFAALVVAHGVLCIFISKILNSWRLALVLWFLLCVSAAGIAYKNSRPEPKPHLALSLRIGDLSASPIFLTNEFFFQRGLVNTIAETNGFILFNGRAMGCIIIPTQTDESNKVFYITAENDSPVKITDLAIMVGFPKEWEIGLDPNGWDKAGEHWTIPGHRLDVTNLQYWLMRDTPVLFPSDSVTPASITNFSIPKFNNPTNKAGLIELFVRSTDFESLDSANVIFIRTPLSAFKPFVSGMKKDTNGIWRPSITFKEMKDLEK
jgi:hypothetical protein